MPNFCNIVSDDIWNYSNFFANITFIITTEMHPQILESPRLYPEVEGNRLVFKCEFKSNTKEDVARFHVSWYEESPLRQLGKVDILKGTERVAKLQRSLNSSSGMSLFRLGKTVCITCTLNSL